MARVPAVAVTVVNRIRKSPHLLTRPRLLRRLDASTEPVVVVSAPAGAGKTVLLTEWSRSLGTRGACAWLSLDAHDNAPGRLWAGILRALQYVRPELPVRLELRGSCGCPH